MKETVLSKSSQEKRIEEFIRLLKFATIVAKEIGIDKILDILEQLNTEKKFDWIEKNKDKLNLKGSTDVERAYDLIYNVYLQINSNDVEIVEKTNTKLVMRWKNFCPLLEACKILRLDTRIICKRTQEKPWQPILSIINPKLRLKRNYEKIRPHCDYCEETIELVD